MRSRTIEFEPKPAPRLARDGAPWVDGATSARQAAYLGALVRKLGYADPQAFARDLLGVHDEVELRRRWNKALVSMLIENAKTRLAASQRKQQTWTSRERASARLKKQARGWCDQEVANRLAAGATAPER